MGKRRLEEAITKAKRSMPNLDFDIRWRPFQLNAQAPEGKGVHKLDYYKKKFGEQRVAAMVPRMIETGKKHDINFSYGGYVGNTFDSHRMIYQAREQGGSELQDKVVESLFKAYFEEEKSLGEVGVLIECGKRAGMDVTRLVEDKHLYRQETLNELQMYSRGCRGVPMFIIDEKFALSGAQDADTLLEVFDEVCSS